MQPGESVTFRKWSERRIGEMMAELRDAGKLAEGTKGKGRPKLGGSAAVPPKTEPSLSAQGVDKHLADRSRKAYGMPLAMFEAEVQSNGAITCGAPSGSSPHRREGTAPRRDPGARLSASSQRPARGAVSSKSAPPAAALA
jgi:hypothetical protein